MKALLRVIFDTNVAVALEVFADPRLVMLSAAWDAGELVALADEGTLAEFERVLHYPALKLDEVAAARIGPRYRARCRLVEPDSQVRAVLPRCRDRDDQKFLELAQRGEADWLLTRDKALLRVRKAVRFAIATPEEMTLERPQAAG